MSPALIRNPCSSSVASTKSSPSPIGEGARTHNVIAFTDRGVSIESHVSNPEELDELVEFVENHCLAFAHKKKYKISIKVVD